MGVCVLGGGGASVCGSGMRLEMGTCDLGLLTWQRVSSVWVCYCVVVLPDRALPTFSRLLIVHTPLLLLYRDPGPHEVCLAQLSRTGSSPGCAQRPDHHHDATRIGCDGLRLLSYVSHLLHHTPGRRVTGPRDRVEALSPGLPR